MCQRVGVTVRVCARVCACVHEAAVTQDVFLKWSYWPCIWFQMGSIFSFRPCVPCHLRFSKPLRVSEQDLCEFCPVTFSLRPIGPAALDEWVKRSQVLDASAAQGTASPQEGSGVSLHVNSGISR